MEKEVPLYFSLDLKDILYVDIQENICIEKWKDVIGFENIYQISNLGRLKVLDRIVNHRREGFICKRKTKIKLPCLNTNGYFYVNLISNTLTKRTTLHRLVALHFVPNPYNKKEVNHIDGNKSNNTFFNLEWNTAIENTQNTFLIGHPAKRIKLSFEKATKIKKLYNKGNTSYGKLSKLFGVQKSAIRDIIKNKSWNF